ncbi:Protein of unknown function [Pyronema omphalodes CBS 100304]|uniref:Uncharacterized protein n=1 Tax=Pyronema omphalodes (strain CBS 100304) TaxID=1076935 RepID=U4LXM7_PYROM|nr:Protein of unknown function [Pyronema omphalodes CBS 100304]
MHTHMVIFAPRDSRQIYLVHRWLLK